MARVVDLTDDPAADTSVAKFSARPSRWRTDLWLVAAVTLASYFIASALELQESITSRLARFESWQADEIPTSLTVLACGLAWYALRRRRETHALLVLREQAEARIADLLEHKRELAQQLISLQEGERLALARELHDELGQGCTAIRVETAYLANIARTIDAQATPADRDAMLAAAGRADEAALSLYESVRDMLRRLRPANLDALGLVAALQELCDSWAARTGVRCTLQVDGDTSMLGDTIDITIYRVAQEALTNVTRHAQARKVTMRLARSAPGELTLTIQDDGRGMEAGVATRGFGLLGAVERAAAVGGELQVKSSPGAGVQLVLRIPLHQSHQAAQAQPRQASLLQAAPAEPMRAALPMAPIANAASNTPAADHTPSRRAA